MTRVTVVGPDRTELSVTEKAYRHVYRPAGYRLKAEAENERVSADNRTGDDDAGADGTEAEPERPDDDPPERKPRRRGRKKSK